MATFACNLLQQILVHPNFLPVHLAAKLMLPHEVCIVARFRLQHLLLQHLSVNYQILLPLRHFFQLLTRGTIIVVLKLLYVHFLVFEIFLSLVLLLIYLVCKQLLHLHIFLSLHYFCLFILLLCILILLDTLIDIVTFRLSS